MQKKEWDEVHKEEFLGIKNQVTYFNKLFVYKVEKSQQRADAG